MIHNSIVTTIGNTPVVKLNKLKQKFNLKANLFAKLENFNPCGSVKDRVGFAMLSQAMRDGKVNNQTTIVEATSGNTGIALAFLCAYYNFSLVLTMPESMSMERQKLLKALGAKLVLTPKREGMQGAVLKASQLLRETPNAVMLNQFENPANPNIHKTTTAKEIWKDFKKHLHVFVAGVGTGGTITGVGEALKQKNKHLHVVAVEPSQSPVLTGGVAGSHGIMGIGAGFVPKVLNQNVIDQIVLVSTQEAKQAANDLVKTEGILTGFSGGANLFAAMELAKNPKWHNKNILFLLPDSGERYLSTNLFDYDN